MPRALVALSLLALPTLAACSDKGDEAWSPHCDSTESPLALDEESLLGFSGQDVLDAVGGDHSLVFSYDRGGSTPLSLDLDTSGATATSVHLFEAEPPDGVTEYATIGVVCEDYLAVEVGVDFATEDGAFDEPFATVLRAWEATSATFSHEWEDVAEVQGSFDFSTLASGDADASSASLYGTLTDQGSSGELTYQEEGEDEDTAWASNVPVGSWDVAGAEE